MGCTHFSKSSPTSKRQILKILVPNHLEEFLSLRLNCPKVALVRGQPPIYLKHRILEVFLYYDSTLCLAGADFQRLAQVRGYLPSEPLNSHDVPSPKRTEDRNQALTHSSTHLWPACNAPHLAAILEVDTIT